MSQKIINHMNGSHENEDDKRYKKGPPNNLSPSLRKRNEMWKFESSYMDARRDLIPMDWGPDMRSSPYYVDRHMRPGSRWGRTMEPHPHDPEWWPGAPPRRLDRMSGRPSDFLRNRFDHPDRIQKWDLPESGRPPLQLEDEFKNVEIPMRNQLFRGGDPPRRREMVEPSRNRNNLNVDLLERELETEMIEDRRRHKLEMDRRNYYSLYGPSFDDPDHFRHERRRKMPWAENWDHEDRSNSRRGWYGDSQREFENTSRRLPSLSKYEEVLREKELLLQSQREKDFEIEKYKRQLQRHGIPDPVRVKSTGFTKTMKIGDELGQRRQPRQQEPEIPDVKELPVDQPKSFLSQEENKKSPPKPSIAAKNEPEEENGRNGFRDLSPDQEENPHPRVKISYIQMNENEQNREESESDLGNNYSRLKVKVIGDRVQVLQDGCEISIENESESAEVFQGDEEELGEDMFEPKRLNSQEERKSGQLEPPRRNEELGKPQNQKSGEFRLKIAKKSGAVRIAENQPHASSSLKNLANFPKRSLSLEDFKPDAILGNQGTKDKWTQTKNNPVINFLGKYSLNKLSTVLKKQPEITESQMLYISQKRGKGRPHKNKENAPFHCLLNKDKETIITEELDNIISSFVVCSLQDKQVSLKIKDFSFWMKNRLFEVRMTTESFKTASVPLRDQPDEFLKEVSNKLLEKCFDQSLVNKLEDFRGVFMLDFLIYNTIKTRLITETVSLNFNTLNRLRNSQELTLPLVLASFLFLVSNFLIPSKFEMFYAYSCFLFSTLFQKTIESCILHLSGRSTQLEFSIQKLATAAVNAQEDIENAYQRFVNGGAPFSSAELKIFVESEKQLQFNSLLVHYIGIFAMLLE